MPALTKTSDTMRRPYWPRAKRICQFAWSAATRGSALSLVSLGTSRWSSSSPAAVISYSSSTVHS